MFYKFQEEALTISAPLNKVAYYYDMGLGKTFIGAEKMVRLDEEINLIVCQKSKVDDWVNHCKLYTGFKVYNLTKTSSIQKYIHDDTQRVGIINYDLIWRREELTDFIRKNHVTLMLDESSLIQNERTKRSKTILNLDPDNVILLSGTPVSGKYEKIWSQVKLLGWKISKKEFWDKYVKYHELDMGTGFPIKVVDGYKNVYELRLNLKKHGAFFMKTEEAYDLPKQTFVNVKIPITKDYKRFKKTGVLEEKDYIGDTVFKQMLYERKLASSDDKYKAFEDLLNSTEDRVIVFYSFMDEAEKLRKIIKKTGRTISEVSGNVYTLRNYEEHDDSVTLVQYQAGSMGLNLQKANKIVYFSPPVSCDLWMQSKKRIHRIGQEKNCIYYKFTMKNSIEEKIYESLERGEDFTDRLFRKTT